MLCHILRSTQMRQFFPKKREVAWQYCQSRKQISDNMCIVPELLTLRTFFGLGQSLTALPLPESADIPSCETVYPKY